MPQERKKCKSCEKIIEPGTRFISVLEKFPDDWVLSDYATKQIATYHIDCYPL